TPAPPPPPLSLHAALPIYLRARESKAPESRRSRAPVPSVRPDDTRLAAASEAIDRVFGKSRSDVKAREAKDLLRELERLLGEKRSEEHTSELQSRENLVCR